MAMARCCWCGARQNDLVSTPAGEYSNELKPGLRPRCPVSVYLPIFIRHFFVEGTVVLQRYLTLLPQWRIKINTRGTSGQKNHRKNQIRSSAFFRHFRHFLILSLKLRRPSVGGWPPLNKYVCHKAPPAAYAHAHTPTIARPFSTSCFVASLPIPCCSQTIQYCILTRMMHRPHK